MYIMKSTVKKVVMIGALMLAPVVAVSSAIAAPNGDVQIPKSSKAATTSSNHSQPSEVFLKELNKVTKKYAGTYDKPKEFNAFKKEFDELGKKYANKTSEKENKEFLELAKKIRIKHKVYDEKKLSVFAKALRQVIEENPKALVNAPPLLELLKKYEDGSYDKGDLMSPLENLIPLLEANGYKYDNGEYRAAPSKDSMGRP